MASVRASETKISAMMTTVSEALARTPGEDAAAQRERVLTYVEQMRNENGVESDPELRQRLRARAAEWPTGGSADANVNRFLKTFGDERHLGRMWLTHEHGDLRRAAALRHVAMLAGRNRVSAIDAMVVAMSERLSLRRGVTILTSDIDDLTALVEAAARPNIAVMSVDRG